MQYEIFQSYAISFPVKRKLHTEKCTHTAYYLRVLPKISREAWNVTPSLKTTESHQFDFQGTPKTWHPDFSRSYE